MVCRRCDSTRQRVFRVCHSHTYSDISGRNYFLPEGDLLSLKRRQGEVLIHKLVGSLESYTLAHSTQQKMAFRAGSRLMSTAARSTLKIGLLPADGIGHEVIPVPNYFLYYFPEETESIIGSKTSN